MKSANQPVTTIPEPVLRHPVVGRNLTPGVLKDQLGERTLLIFLRHLG